MMSVLEYAEDMNKEVEEILSMCKSLGINVSNEDDMLNDDAIVELDNAFANMDSKDDSEEDALDEEIIKKMDEDDYYDEVVDTLIDKKDTIYNSEPQAVKKKKSKQKNIQDAKKAMYKNKENVIFFVLLFFLSLKTVLTSEKVSADEDAITLLFPFLQLL